jgi:hypothetical protein
MLALLPICTLAIGIGSLRAEPSAIVEDAQPEVPGAEFLALLDPGQIIELPADATLVLGYLRSCTRETITGGRVEIGESESRVTGGKVVRGRASCPGGARETAAGPQDRVMAGVGVRSVNQGEATPATAPKAGEDGAALMIRSQQPLIVLPTEGGQLEIRKLPTSSAATENPEVAEAILSLQPPVATLAAKTKLVDLGKEQVRLEPGKSYILISGSRTLRVEVAAGAEATPGPPLSRLVQF